MGLRTAKILQAFFVVMLAWWLYSVLGGWHWLLAVVLLLVAISNSVVVWMLRENRETLARLCRKQLLNKYVRGVCYVTGQQMPTSDLPAATVDSLLLRSHRDFQTAGDRAKQIVRGHDEVLDRVLTRVFENASLRKTRRTSKSVGPNATFLFIGDPGIGKRYLSRVLSKLLYRSGCVNVFECDRITSESLVGIKGREGDLLEVVRRDPFQVLIFERIDRARDDVGELLARMLTTGQLSQPGSESTVSFQHATVVFTTTRSDSLERLEETSLGHSAWQQRAIEYLRDELQMNAGLLSAIDEVLLCSSPSDETKSEVISLLMQKECRAHGIELCHVDPVIIGTQVLHIDDDSGFAHAPSRIKKLLSKPLVAASSDDNDSLSLRVTQDAQRPLTKLER